MSKKAQRDAGATSIVQALITGLLPTDVSAQVTSYMDPDSRLALYESSRAGKRFMLSTAGHATMTLHAYQGLAEDAWQRRLTHTQKALAQRIGHQRVSKLVLRLSTPNDAALQSIVSRDTALARVAQRAVTELEVHQDPSSDSRFYGVHTPWLQALPGAYPHLHSLHINRLRGVLPAPAKLPNLRALHMHLVLKVPPPPAPPVRPAPRRTADDALRRARHELRDFVAWVDGLRRPDPPQDSYSQPYSERYSEQYSGLYSGQYSGLYSEQYSGLYSGQYSGLYSGQYSGPYSGPYSDEDAEWEARGRQHRRDESSTPRSNRGAQGASQPARSDSSTGPGRETDTDSTGADRDSAGRPCGPQGRGANAAGGGGWDQVFQQYVWQQEAALSESDIGSQPADSGDDSDSHSCSQPADSSTSSSDSHSQPAGKAPDMRHQPHSPVRPGKRARGAAGQPGGHCSPAGAGTGSPGAAAAPGQGQGVAARGGAAAAHGTGQGTWGRVGLNHRGASGLGPGNIRGQGAQGSIGPGSEGVEERKSEGYDTDSHTNTPSSNGPTPWQASARPPADPGCNMAELCASIAAYLPQLTSLHISSEQPASEQPASTPWSQILTQATHTTSLAELSTPEPLTNELVGAVCAHAPRLRRLCCDMGGELLGLSAEQRWEVWDVRELVLASAEAVYQDCLAILPRCIEPLTVFPDSCGIIHLDFEFSNLEEFKDLNSWLQTVRFTAPCHAELTLLWPSHDAATAALTQLSVLPTGSTISLSSCTSSEYSQVCAAVRAAAAAHPHLTILPPPIQGSDTNMALMCRQNPAMAHTRVSDLQLVKPHNKVAWQCLHVSGPVPWRQLMRLPSPVGRPYDIALQHLVIEAEEWTGADLRGLEERSQYWTFILTHKTTQVTLQAPTAGIEQPAALEQCLQVLRCFRWRRAASAVGSGSIEVVLKHWSLTLAVFSLFRDLPQFESPVQLTFLDCHTPAHYNVRRLPSFVPACYATWHFEHIDTSLHLNFLAGSLFEICEGAAVWRRTAGPLTLLRYCHAIGGVMVIGRVPMSRGV